MTVRASRSRDGRERWGRFLRHPHRLACPVGCLHDATTPAATVTIAEGQVAEITYAEA
ncbi:hypothetical protein [Catellatospora methionotrophica]|uniref:hypothetical protein n=1 Tax=Catellatospora methionotrophica TaxID=121620 RepID=UPI0033E2F4BD